MNERKNVQPLGSGSRTSKLYRPEMRARDNMAQVGGRTIGEKWEPCPYEVLVGPAGYVIGRIGVAVPTHIDRADLDYGLPYEIAEAIRWSYLAECRPLSSYGILTRIREVEIKRTYEAVAYDCEPYGCAHWDLLRDAALSGPAAQHPRSDPS